MSPSSMREAAKRTESEIRDAGGEAIAVVTDVSSEESTRSMVQQVVAAYGKVDILINDAAHRRCHEKRGTNCPSKNGASRLTSI